MKSGINASLSLDLIKELPDFLLTDEKIESYMYASSDIAVIDDRLAHVIYFEQKGNINSALYRGRTVYRHGKQHIAPRPFRNQPQIH